MVSFGDRWRDTLTMEGHDPRTHSYTPLQKRPSVDVERLGGERFVDTLVATLHDKIMADPVISRFFSASTPERVMAMEREYVTVSLGGTGGLASSKLREAHAGRGITEAHFHRFLDIFVETLRHHDVAEEYIDHAIDRMAIASTDVLDMATEAG